MARLDDPGRLQALAHSGLMDTGAEEAFDRFARLAAELLETPRALISVVSDARHHNKSRVGVEVTEVPLDQSICRIVVEDEAPVLIPDTAADARLAANQIVTSLRIASYCGVPLRTLDGHVLGSLSVMGAEPRRWYERDLRLLEELAAGVMREIELRAINRALVAAEHDRRTIFESSLDAIVETDESGTVLAWNPAADQLFGWSAAEALGKSAAELIAVPELEGHRLWFGAVAETNPSARRSPRRAMRSRHRPIELEALNRDGARLHLEVSLTPYETERGSRLYAAVRDVTVRKRAERALAEAGQRQATMLANLPGTIVALYDRQLRLIEIQGGPAGPQEHWEPSLGTTVHEHLLPGELERVEAPLLAALLGHTRAFEFVNRDGRAFEVQATPFSDGGAITGVLTVWHDVTGQRTLERLLKDAQELARLGSWELPPGSEVAVWSDQLCRIFGVPDGFTPTHAEFMQYVHPEDREAVLALQRTPDPTTMVESTFRIIRRDGGVRWINSRRYIRGQLHGEEPVHTFGVMQDVTESHDAMRALRSERERLARNELILADSERRFRGIFEDAPIGMALISPDTLIAQANKALGVICGRSRIDLAGMRVRELVHPADLQQMLGLLSAAAEGEEGLDLDVRFLTAAGGAIDVSVHAVAMPGEDGADGLVLCQFQDISERKRYENQLQFMAEHDPLTGLLNRRKFEAELERHVAHVRRYGAHGALMVLDIDNFKQVNDTLGHNAGDQLIIAISGALRERLRATDVLGRLGGDEFAILLPHASDEEATRVAEQLVQTVREKSMLLGGERAERHRVTISLGVALFDRIDDQMSADAMLVEADLAMYDAKEAGRDRYAVNAGGPHAESKTKARLTWVTRIEEALHSDRFTLVAQPILNLRTERVNQYELLLRMLDDHGDQIPPASFLGIAERFGLIGRIDEWVSHQAIDMIASNPELQLEVNISGRSLGDQRLLVSIERRLDQAGIDPSRLIFEVTETAAVANLTHAQVFAQRLRDLGCRFALDDFGAGFGSFYYLKHLPFDYIKIDGEFVQHVASGAMDQLVIEAVVRIARGIGKETIAEFVTDDRTQRMIARLGVDFAQGYHIAKPIPVRELLAADAR